MNQYLAFLLTAFVCYQSQAQATQRDLLVKRIPSNAERCISLMEDSVTSQWTYEERTRWSRLLIVASRFVCVDDAVRSGVDSMFQWAARSSDSVMLKQKWTLELAPSGFSPANAVSAELEYWLAETSKVVKSYEVAHTYLDVRANPKWSTVRHAARSAIIIGIGYHVFSEVLRLTVPKPVSPMHPLLQYNLEWTDLVNADPEQFNIIFEALPEQELIAMDQGLQCIVAALRSKP